ncbi:MAG TPA: hypothetical protein VGP22_16970, partial [Albitalea sp.]|nr:hypothetical protein [Albitalea sp.]
MPTIVQTAEGKVTGLWGAALIRGADGKMRALKLGEVIHRGDVILTTQDGIVELSPEAATRTAATPAGDDIDRVITALDNDDPTAATAAVVAGDGGSEVGQGLRVDRVSESTTGAGALPSPGERVTTTASITGNQITAPQQQAAAAAPQPDPAPGAAASSSISATEEGPTVGLSLHAPAGTAGSATVVVGQVPVIGQIQTAGGAVVTAGTALTAADLAGLRYVPPAEYDGSTPVGDFSYTLDNGVSTTSGTTQIGLSAVNDAPRATTAAIGGLEDSTLPVSLGGLDTDGSVAGVTITSIPAGSTLLLADGVTRVSAGETLTPAEAAGLLFQPSADYNGSTGI